MSDDGSAGGRGNRDGIVVAAAIDDDALVAERHAFKAGRKVLGLVAGNDDCAQHDVTCPNSQGVANCRTFRRSASLKGREKGRNLFTRSFARNDAVLNIRTETALGETKFIPPPLP